MAAPLSIASITMNQATHTVTRPSYDYLVIISGGLGPNVWETELTIMAPDILEAAHLSAQRADTIDTEARVVSIEQAE